MERGQTLTARRRGLILMLTRIHIQNFRLCRDVRIDHLGHIVALVGRNGAGKSNILQAIAQAANMATSREAIGFPEAISPGERFSVTVEFTTDDTVYRYELSTRLTVSPGPVKPVITEMLERQEGDTWRCLIRREAGTVRVGDRSQPLPIGEFVPCLPALATLLPAADDVVVSLRPALKFLSAIRYYPLDEPAAAGRGSGPIPGSQYAEWAANYEATGKSGDSVLLRLIYMSQKRQRDFEALKSLLGPDGLALIDEIQVSPINMARQPSGSGAAIENTYYIVMFIPSRGPEVPPVSVTAAGLSAGTRRVLRMLVSMIFDASTVMLLEQPEDSLHQGLTKKVIGLLRENAESQLIVSSHSSALLNKLQPDDIRLVSLHDGLTVVRRLTPKEQEAAAKFMNEEGPLYDFISPLQEE